MLNAVADFHSCCFAHCSPNFLREIDREGIQKVSRYSRRRNVIQYHQDMAIRFDNIYFQYRMGLIPDSYFQDVTVGVRKFAPLWKSLGMMDDLVTSKLKELIAEIGE